MAARKEHKARFRGAWKRRPLFWLRSTAVACVTSPTTADEGRAAAVAGITDLANAVNAAKAARSKAPQDRALRVLDIDEMTLVAGQDKGTMLKRLMDAIGGSDYVQAIGTEDGRKNIDALATSRSPLPLLHYRRIVTQVTTVEGREARAQLRQLSAVLCLTRQATFCRGRAPALDGAGQ